jgi:hypothetical protein
VQTCDAGDKPTNIALMGPDLVIAHHERKSITVHSRAGVYAAVDRGRPSTDQVIGALF